MTERTFITEYVTTIDQPIEMVWAIVGAFSGIKCWMPGIDSCEVFPNEKGEINGIGATRRVRNTTENMFVKETLEILDNKNHYISYRLHDDGHGFPFKGCRGNNKLTAKGENCTEFKWWTDADEISPEGVEFAAPKLAPFFKQGVGELRKIVTRPQVNYL
ncbi:hypothetical protein BKA56DRAFT_603576 [Ilyonectria sp. MPI-CAGE-AT-0026]|nr:hypothetical protein BKA56DRAFT_603576 [Ilyonectria sp. MPI-CAGE-AT-0026]